MKMNGVVEYKGNIYWRTEEFLKNGVQKVVVDGNYLF